MEQLRPVVAALLLMVPLAACSSPSAVEAAKSPVEQKAIKIVSEQLGLDAGKVKLDARLMAELGADSLDFVELVMAFEEEFRMSISDNDAMKLVTVRDFIRYAEQHKNSDAQIPSGK